MLQLSMQFSDYKNKLAFPLPSISKSDQALAILNVEAEAKSQNYQIYKSKNLTQFLRYVYDFLHVSTNLMDFKITC